LDDPEDDASQLLDGGNYEEMVKGKIENFSSMIPQGIA
jgi:hypothetical protein